MHSSKTDERGRGQNSHGMEILSQPAEPLIDRTFAGLEACNGSTAKALLQKEKCKRSKRCVAGKRTEGQPVEARE